MFRKVRGILNKFTPEKFDKLTDSLLQIGLDSDVILKGVILLIINKALDEPKFCFLYALLCKRLVTHAPNYDPPGESCTFLRLLLSKCKDEFDNRSSITRELQKSVSPLSTSDEERLLIAKQKMLGNVRFISELGKLGLVPLSVLHSCAQELLPRSRSHAPVADVCADLECLCQLMSTCGHQLDTAAARPLMDQYFDRMQMLAGNGARHWKLPARIRFLLQNTVELRATGWQVRPNVAQETPRTVTAIRQEARSCGVVLPIAGETTPPTARPEIAGLLGSRARGRAEAFGKARGMDEVFGSVGAGSALGMLGTGPGVIAMEPHYGGPGGAPSRYMGSVSAGASIGRHYTGALSNKPNNHQYNHHHNNSNYSNNNNSHYQQQNFSSMTSTYSHDSVQKASDLAPRFKRAMSGVETLSLRPGAHCMPLKPQTAARVGATQSGAVNGSAGGRSARGGGAGGGVGAPNTSADQRARGKQPQLSRQQLQERVLKMAGQLVWPADDPQENNSNGDGEWTVQPACSAWLELKPPSKHIAHLVQELLIAGAEKQDGDRLMMLFAALSRTNAVSSGVVVDALRQLLSSQQLQQSAKPTAVVAEYLAAAVNTGLITIKEMACDATTSEDYPLLFLALKKLENRAGKDKLFELFTKSEVSLISHLPAAKRNRDDLSTALDHHQLQHLYPLLNLQSQLAQQLRSDPSEVALYRWIRANIQQPAQQNSVEFVQALFHSVIEFVIERAESVNGAEPVESSSSVPAAPTAPASSGACSEVQRRERHLLASYRQLLQAFVHDRQQLQLAAVYAVQLVAAGRGFPRGLLLRWFVLLYDLEIVDEEGFLAWREDIDDQYPDKGKALFQVNQWLTWLEQAESDDENGGEN